MDESGFILPVERWNVLNLGYFLEPNSYQELNPFPSTRVGDVHPERSSVDRLAEVVEGFVCSAHQCQYKDPSRSYELPDPVNDLDISALPSQVCDQVLLSQRPNHFLRTSELTLFTVATDSFEDDNNDDCIVYSWHLVPSQLRGF